MVWLTLCSSRMTLDLGTLLTTALPIRRASDSGSTCPRSVVSLNRYVWLGSGDGILCEAPRMARAAARRGTVGKVSLPAEDRACKKPRVAAAACLPLSDRNENIGKTVGSQGVGGTLAGVRLPDGRHWPMADGSRARALRRSLST